MYANQLVTIADYYGFDGWLINIENPIATAQLEVLLHFLQYLTRKVFLWIIVFNWVLLPFIIILLEIYEYDPTPMTKNGLYLIYRFGYHDNVYYTENFHSKRVPQNYFR